VAAKQADPVWPQGLGHGLGLIHFDDDNLRIAKIIAVVPDRNGCAHHAPDMGDRFGRFADVAERDQFDRVAMTDRCYIGPGGIDGGMDDAFAIGLDITAVDQIAVQIKFMQVTDADQIGCQRAGENEAPRIIGVTGTDMAEPDQQPFLGQDVIGEGQFTAGLIKGHIGGHIGCCGLDDGA
jgi:hypothetical protein